MEIQNRENQLFRYRKPNEFTLDELEHSYIYFPSSNELNDPFDASHLLLSLTKNNSEMESFYHQLYEMSPNELTRAYIKKYYENKPDLLRKLVVEGTVKFISTYGIACYSVSPVHIVLWAIYADNHEGICIQYDTVRDEPFFREVRRIDYVEKLEIINYEPFSNPQVTNDIFYKKLNLWEKEFEVRLVKPKTGKHEINPECVRSVVLGLRAKEDYIEKVIDIMRRKYKHATLYQTEIMTESVGLSFIPFDL
ncbi:MAG: hypothetical protein LCH35_10205 [Bacteroidetes bacterium]|jgi:hypothetical protein|uniref:hypothetical protein n=1 Tax=Flavobacterium sp. TaxID=239 RepID=UPI002FD93D8C|nr:hypothetical protein [Bacteroidota bacterium]